MAKTARKSEDLFRLLGCSTEDHNSALAQNTEQMQAFRCVKNIMINCASLAFRVEYEHVDARQDDEKKLRC